MNDFFFPDSAVEQFFSEQNKAVLAVSDVGFKGALVQVKITVEGYSLLQENNGEGENEYENIETLNMQALDGEVLKVSCYEDGFDVLIQWDFFNPRKSSTSSYKIRGDKLSVVTGSPYPDERK